MLTPHILVCRAHPRRPAVACREDDEVNAEFSERRGSAAGPTYAQRPRHNRTSAIRQLEQDRIRSPIDCPGENEYRDTAYRCNDYGPGTNVYCECVRYRAEILNFFRSTVSRFFDTSFNGVELFIYIIGVYLRIGSFSLLHKVMGKREGS